MTSTARRGSHFAKNTVRDPDSKARNMIPTPPMWRGGKLTSDTSSGAPAISAGIVACSASTVLCVCWTPLGAEVVPDEYISRQTSTDLTSGRTYPSDRTSDHPSQPGPGSASTTTTWRNTEPNAVAMDFVAVISTEAPACLTMKPTPPCPEMCTIGTNTAPLNSTA